MPWNISDESKGSLVSRELEIQVTQDEYISCRITHSYSQGVLPGVAFPLAVKTIVISRFSIQNRNK